MSTIMMQQLSVYELARIKFRDEFKKGITPVDGRQPIPDELAKTMVQELIDLEVPKDALIGIFDAFLILSTHLKEVGYSNLVLLENTHNNLSNAQETYYNNVQNICEKSGIKYYVPSMNNYGRCNMKFDVIIGNPPYQSGDGNGDLSGSGTGALWWKITDISVKLLKDNGIISFVTPTNILSGGDSYSKMILGNKRKLDLKTVKTNINSYFPKVGTKICRWVAQKSVTLGNTAIVNENLVINVEKTLKIYNDLMVQNIIQTLINSNQEKFDISVKNTADPRAVSKKLEKEGMSKVESDKVARDFSKVQSKSHPYPINSNGKIKYGKVKWNTYGTWKMMIPHMGSPFKYEIVVSDVVVCDQSCDVQYFDSEEDALKTKLILDNPIYRWIIEQTRVGGRMSTSILSKFPNAPIEEVLTSEQLAYIQSQL
jgi:hypothetical protein